MAKRTYTREEIRNGWIIIGIIVLMFAAGGIISAFKGTSDTSPNHDACEQAWTNYGQYGEHNMPVTHSAYIQKCEQDDSNFLDQTGQ